MNTCKTKVLAIVSLLAVVMLSNQVASSSTAWGWSGSVIICQIPSPQPTVLTLPRRSRVETPESSGKFTVLSDVLEWKASETAIIICDMWDQHWCKGVTRRVTELAPHINSVVSKGRSKGVLIIHAPSGTVDYYSDHPARKRAQNAPKAANLPQDIGKSCKWINQREEKAGYPIDHSDGGCDCEPKCETGRPWRKQIDAIEIHNEDAISDSGVEIWNLLQHRGINNVILMGVHTNMCVLGRPFGLRNMARFGKNVVLMRDLTDTMYNPRMQPYVSHFTGTDLIVEHIEKFVCPTVSSTTLTGKPPFRFADDKRPRVVFISAENEYQAAQTLPEFAHELQLKYGTSCEILQGSTDLNSEQSHHISGMQTLEGADLVVLFARRRAFPAEQMKYFHDYLDKGKPLIALRTASHAFDTRGNAPDGHAEWLNFDPEVLGGNYNGHYGRGPVTTVTIAAGAESHPILAGIETPFTSIGSLYKVSPLSSSTTPLLMGRIPNQEPEPVAWTNRYKDARVFYSSLGHPDDFDSPQFCKLLINAVFWAMDKPVPK